MRIGYARANTGCTKVMSNPSIVRITVSVASGRIRMNFHPDRAGRS
jgi:hypothetical protein